MEIHFNKGLHWHLNLTVIERESKVVDHISQINT